MARGFEKFNLLGTAMEWHLRRQLLTTTLDTSSIPKGWLDWNNHSKLNSIDYEEHQNIGIGSQLSKQVKWKECRANLSEAEIQVFNIRKNLIKKKPIAMRFSK